MEEPAAATVVDILPAEKLPPSPAEVKRKKRKSSDFQVTAFQPAMAMPDLLDPQPTSEPVSSDDTSPSSFLGTPYSTTLQFDYPFPISNEPRDPTLHPTPLPSALPIASSIASAPSLVSVAVAHEESTEPTMASPLLSTIAANPDLPVNVNLGELRALPNQSSSSLNSTHSGHTAPILIPVASSGASGRSVSPPSSLKLSSMGLPMTVPVASPPAHGQRQKGRHSLSIFPVPPPSISMHTNVLIPPVSPPPQVRRPKASTSNSTNSIASDLSTDSTSPPNASRPTSTSLSSISLASLQLMSGPNEPPIPPSLLNKLNNRPRNISANSNTTSYFSPNVGTHKPSNSRDFFGSPGVENPSFISAPNSPPTNASTDSGSDAFKPSSPPSSRSPFSSFRPQLGRSNSSNNHSTRGMSRPFFMRSSTTTNSQLQSRAYAQHLRHQQEQQLKLQEEQQKKKAEKKEKKKLRRSSLSSLSRSPSSSSSSSIMTRNSSKSKSPTSSSSQADGFKLSPSSSSAVESAVEESEGSVSPEGTKLRRRRSSVRRVLEKTGSLVGFNLHLNSSKRGGHS